MGPLRDPGTCRWHFTKWSINKKFISIILLWGKFQVFDYCVVVGLAGVGGVSVPDCFGEPRVLPWCVLPGWAQLSSGGWETRIDKSGQWGVSFIYPG